MTFNDLLMECGEFGLYQKYLTFGLLTHTLALASWAYWTHVFILLIPPHRCKLTPDDNEWIFAGNYSLNDSAPNICYMGQENDSSQTCLYGILYDFSSHFPTFATKHDWVCQNSWKMYLAHSCYWAGAVLGTILVCGIVSDRYGRKIAYQVSVTVTLISDVVNLFCSEEITFLIARFCSAIGQGTFSPIALILVMEYVGPSKRGIVLFFFAIPMSVTASIMPWIAYAAHDWKHILMISYIPSAIAILISFWIPESASWLITRGRNESAIVYIQKMAQVNGKEMSVDYIKSKLKQEEVMEVPKTIEDVKENKRDGVHNQNADENVKKMNCMSYTAAISKVLKAPNLRKRIAFFLITWFITSSCYYGNCLELNNLPINFYTAFSIVCLSEIPANVFCILAVDRLGRRWSSIVIFILGGVSRLVRAAIDSNVAIIALSLLMRFCYAAAYDITITFSSESLPTVIRGRGVAVIRIIGCIGNGLAPFVVILSETKPLVPHLLFGTLFLFAGIITMFLPETSNQHLPHTIEEGENFGKDQSFCFWPNSKNSLQREENANHQREK